MLKPHKQVDANRRRVFQARKFNCNTPQKRLDRFQRSLKFGDVIVRHRGPTEFRLLLPQTLPHRDFQRFLLDQNWLYVIDLIWLPGPDSNQRPTG
jgi:hypothetical protein